VICRRTDPETWDVDTWLMSCRVLGRKVENMVLRELRRQARLAGVNVLTGSYLPTERNKLVVDHYSKLGFSQVGEASPDGATRWRQPVDSPEPETPPMKVVLVGLSN